MNSKSSFKNLFIPLNKNVIADEKVEQLQTRDDIRNPTKQIDANEPELLKEPESLRTQDDKSWSESSNSKENVFFFIF